MPLTVVKKRGRNYFRNLWERKKFLVRIENDQYPFRTVAIEIAEFIDVRKLDIVMIPTKIPMLSAKYIGFPFFRPCLLITEGCAKLKIEELSGLIAHEIYHLKRHSFKWYLLNLLSEFTLFGSSFLAMTTNSYQHELEADRHAAMWVKKRGSIMDFIHGLQIMHLAHMVAGEINHGLKAIGTRERMGNRNDYKQESWIRRIKKYFNNIFEFYFSDNIFGYIHPPIEERIKRIKALTESEEG